MGNTPGVLTDTTAEMAVALTFAVARRTGAWNRPDVMPFLRGNPPQAAPSILNATEMGIPIYKG